MESEPDCMDNLPFYRRLIEHLKNARTLDKHPPHPIGAADA
jgi:hypothetical protein